MAQLTDGKLPLKTKIGYGIGQAGDTIPYCMFYTFFLWYLTDVVGISPYMGGVISFIAVAWDAVTDPIIGWLSDRSKNPKGRRRPFIFVAAIPLGLSIAAQFYPIGGSDVVKDVYYIFIALAYWFFYTLYVIPYMSLGAEMTGNYNERNNLRTYNMIGGGIFMLICTSGPMVVADKVTAAGLSYQHAWMVSGIIFGAITVIGVYIGWYVTKGYENPQLQHKEDEKYSIKEVLVETFKISAYRRVNLMTLTFMIGQVIGTTICVYLLYDNLQLSEGKQALFWLLYSVIYTVIAPINGVVANLIGRKPAFILISMITFVAMMYFFIFPISGFAQLIVYTVFFNLGSVMFWTFYVGFAYDVAEIDEYKNGKRREGSIVSIVSFSQKFGSAIAMYLCGILLTMVGYDADLEAQTEGAQWGINALCTLGPAFGSLVAAIIMAGYPVSKPKFEALQAAIAAKKAGQTPDESQLKKVLGKKD